MDEGSAAVVTVHAPAFAATPMTSALNVTLVSEVGQTIAVCRLSRKGGRVDRRQKAIVCPTFDSRHRAHRSVDRSYFD